MSIVCFALFLPAESHRSGDTQVPPPRHETMLFTARSPALLRATLTEVNDILSTLD
jgi:hypothetical protein